MTTISESLTFFVLIKPIELVCTNDADNVLTRIAKLGAGCIVFPVAVLADTIEVVVRGVFALLAKLVHFFMPKDAALTRKFEAEILNPSTQSVAINSTMLATCLLLTILSFTKDEFKKKYSDLPWQAFTCIAESSIAKIFYHSHINGVYSPTTSF